MKIFMDENIPSRTVGELRGLGHDQVDAPEILLGEKEPVPVSLTNDCLHVGLSVSVRDERGARK